MLQSYLPFMGYLLLGSVAGTAAGLLGIGGGLLIVPVLAWLFSAQGMEAGVVMHLAIGTSLASIVFTSLSSIRAHHRHRAVHWEVVTHLAPGIVIGALLGAAIADWLPGKPLQRIFGVFELLVALQMLANARPSPHRQLPGSAGMGLAGGVIGAVSSLVGIGGGTLTVPFLYACNVSLREAIATSAACGLPIALAGSLGFVLSGLDNPATPSGALGYVYLPALLGVVLTSVAFAPLGAGLTHRLPVGHIKKVFALLLLALAWKLLITT
ncbi:MAG: sulfite exporter TauE/SafE family protein [bacterium]